jgi:5-methylcytosine-specific restriction enzyme subunit McrC
MSAAYSPEEAAAPIPIQNIYYLLCYAWNRLEEGQVVDVGSVESTRLVDLFAKVLAGGVRHLIRRGFDRGYLPHSEDTATIRGKIDFASSLKRNLLSKARAHCDFDELDYNVLHNRIIKTTITWLVLADGLDRGLREDLRGVLRWLHEVEPVRLTSQVFRRVQLHRNNHYYAFLLNVCEMLYDYLLVDERSGRSRFRDFLRDERRMARLFEDFVRNFYRLEQREFKVESQKILWQAEWGSEEARALLPEMRTDVSLIGRGRKIIIDCKYYSETLRRGAYKQTVHSSHLYQLFAYVKNKAAHEGWESCEGMLLYPVVDRELDLTYRILGHTFRVRTVNLGREWFKVREEMLSNIDVAI